MKRKRKYVVPTINIEEEFYKPNFDILDSIEATKEEKDLAKKEIDRLNKELDDGLASVTVKRR